MPLYLTDQEARLYLRLLAQDATAGPPDAAAVESARRPSRSVHSGRRADLANRYFRSGWEANYARYLNWLLSREQIARWEYEADTFEFPVRRGQRFYTPDFKVWGWDARPVVYHEVKGWLDGPSRTKLARMARYHPTVPLLVVDAPAYHAIRRDLERAIPGWESY